MGRTSSDKVILTCAMSGVVTTRAQCAAIPYTVDEFAETIVRKDGKLFYKYGAELRPVTVSTMSSENRWAAARAFPG